MFNSKFCLSALVLFFLFASRSNAQQVTTGRETKKADVNLRELAEKFKDVPPVTTPRMPLEEGEEEDMKPSHGAGPATEVHLYKGVRQGKNPVIGGGSDEHYHEPMLPSSPAPNDSFLSTVSPGVYIPPDTHGAVDSLYCITAINSNVHVQDRVGANVTNISLDGFWSSILPSGTGSFDPRVHYDPYYKRWIMVTDAVANTSAMNNSTIMIAVSATSDPTGTWHMYSVAVDPSGNSWLDFPNVGFNNKWIVVTGNMFPNTGSGASGTWVYIFDYNAIMSGTGAPFTKITKGSSFSVAPARTYDPTEPNLFCLETWSPNNGQLRLWKISGPVASPSMTSVGYPATSQHWHGSGAYTNFGPQVGTSNGLDIGDDRITSVIYRNQKLWCAHTVFLPSGSAATHSSIMWWQIDTLANPLQVGLINDNSATNPNFFAYPSIAVNKYDDALIGYGIFSKLIHPSAGYSWRMHTDATDSIRPQYIFRHGQATYYTTFGGSKNRWGDYSGSSVDPRNDEDFWTIQEASIAGSTANWDTWWANLQLCPKPLAPALISSIVSLCPGDTTTYFVHSVPGATSYTWNVGGTGWSGVPTDTTILATVGSGVGTISVYANNGCGMGEIRTFHIYPEPPPDVPTISITDYPCTGDTSAGFIASSAGATLYSWQAIGGGWSGTGSTYTFTAHVGTGTGMIICTPYNDCGPGIPDTINVTPGTPVSNFIVSSHITTSGTDVTLTFSGSAPTSATYTWNFSGGVATPGTGAGPQNVHWNAPGTYTVTLTVNNGGCTSTHTDTVHVNHGVGFPVVTATAQSISIAPNPTDGSFDIVFGQAVNKQVTVKMTDIQGRIVYSNDFGKVVNNRLPVSADRLPAGVYAISVYIDGEDAVTRKVVIEK